MNGITTVVTTQWRSFSVDIFAIAHPVGLNVKTKQKNIREGEHRQVETNWAFKNLEFVRGTGQWTAFV